MAKKKSAVLFTLGQLTMLDRKEIVQKGLDTFGKKLSDSAFNNQVLFICFGCRRHSVVNSGSRETPNVVCPTLFNVFFICFFISS